MSFMIDAVLVCGGVGLLVITYLVRVISTKVSKGTDYVYNSGVVNKLSDFTQVRAAELRKKATTAKLTLEDKTVAHSEDTGVLGKVIRFVNNKKGA